MQESFISYIWQFQQFNKFPLVTFENQHLAVVSPGVLNTNSGPDFTDACILLEGIKWYGAVELHVRSSDWIQHQHTEDAAYNQVILHVVWEHDMEIQRNDLTTIPTLEIKPLVSSYILERYQGLIVEKLKYPISCANLIHHVKPITFINMVESSAFMRLNRKALEVNHLIQNNKQSWEETIYQLLSKNFGFHLNAPPFLQLSKTLPIQIIRKHGNSRFQVEALFFGVAGMLYEPAEDEYHAELIKEFHFLSYKYNFQNNQLNLHQWKFMRLRPNGFPTIRIAQLACLLSKENFSLTELLEVQNIDQITSIFSISASDYWNTHYFFGKEFKKKSKSTLGESAVNNLAINTIVPLLITYSRLRDSPTHYQTAKSILQEAAPENNKIIRMWRSFGKKPQNALESQGLIEMYNNYCNAKRCLSCKVGIALMKKT